MRCGPEHLHTRFNLGLVYAGLGRYADASEALQQVLVARPQNARALYAMGEIRLQEGDDAGAAEYFERTLAADTTYAEAHLQLGRIQMRQNDLAAAAARFRRAILIEPGFAESLPPAGPDPPAAGPRGRRRKIPRRLREDQAGRGDIQRYREQLRSDSDDAEAHYSLGFIYNRLGFTGVALPHYAQAVRINPAHVRALNNMGNIYLRTGHFRQAAAAYQQIIQQEPEHVAAFAALGQAYLNQQRTDEAIAMLNRALALDENWLGAHQALAEAYKRLGQIAKSEEHKRLADALIRSKKMIHNAKWFAVCAILLSCVQEPAAPIAEGGGLVVTGTALAQVGDDLIDEREFRRYEAQIQSQHHSLAPGVEKHREHLLSLIDIKLMVREAYERGLDKDPEWIKAVDLARHKAMVEAYIREQVRPTDRDFRRRAAGQFCRASGPPRRARGAHPARQPRSRRFHLRGNRGRPGHL